MANAEPYQNRTAAAPLRWRELWLKEDWWAIWLGLGIVKKIIEKHGGRVDVDSRPGRTCFSIVLPVAGPPGRNVSESRP